MQTDIHHHRESDNLNSNFVSIEAIVRETNNDPFLQPYEKVNILRNLDDELQYIIDESSEFLRAHPAAGYRKEKLLECEKIGASLKDSILESRMNWSCPSLIVLTEHQNATFQRDCPGTFDYLPDARDQEQLFKLVIFSKRKIDPLRSIEDRSVDSEKLNGIRTFRNVHKNLHAKFYEPPPPELRVDYQVPWFYVNSRCSTTSIDHASLGAILGCPPPPKVCANVPSQQETVLCVPNSSDLCRIDKAECSKLFKPKRGSSTFSLSSRGTTGRVDHLVARQRQVIRHHLNILSSTAHLLYTCFCPQTTS
jgi:hypothetical protein